MQMKVSSKESQGEKRICHLLNHKILYDTDEMQDVSEVHQYHRSFQPALSAKLYLTYLNNIDFTLGKKHSPVENTTLVALWYVILPVNSAGLQSYRGLCNMCPFHVPEPTALRQCTVV